MTDLRSTYKDSDAWWTVLLVDPVAVHVLRLAVRLPWVTPNRVTAAAALLGGGAAVCFYRAEPVWLLAGAALYHVAFILDCVDGKLARWRGETSAFGAWLDIAMDRLRVLACTVGLMGGQFVATGRASFLYAGLGIVFLDVFRQWNGLLVFKMRLDMRERLDAASARRHIPAARPDPDGGPELRRGLRRYGRLLRGRDWLLRHRIRPHLISGIEFQMAVFIIAPATGLILAIPLVVGAVFIAFELLVMYKFWLATNDFERALAAVEVPNQRPFGAPVDIRT